MDDVELDLRNMRVKKWKTSALDEREWTCVVRETKAKNKEL